MLSAAWHILCQLSPWLLMGTAIAGLLHVALPRGFIRRRFHGGWGIIKAVALGVPLPLCSCGVVPAGIGLKRDGASDGAAVGFLVSTPQTGVDSVLVSASFLGWPFALFKVFSAAVTGIVGGLLADQTARQPGSGNDPERTPEQSGPRGLRAMVEHALDIVRSIWLWILLGVLVSALIEVYVPPSYFEIVGSWGTFTSSLVVLAISLPLYVCATSSVPIAAVLVAGGLPMGTALVFLMAGPATNVTTIGAVYRTFGLRTLSVYLGTIIVGSIAFALAFDEFMSRPVVMAHAIHDGHTGWVAQASAGLLLGLMSWFAWDDLRRWWRGKRVMADDELRVGVAGMDCERCVHRLERELRSTAGVHSAEVRLRPGQAIIRGEVNESSVRQVIERCGFQSTETERA